MGVRSLGPCWALHALLVGVLLAALALVLAAVPQAGHAAPVAAPRANPEPLPAPLPAGNSGSSQSRTRRILGHILGRGNRPANPPAPPAAAGVHPAHGAQQQGSQTLRSRIGRIGRLLGGRRRTTPAASGPAVSAAATHNDHAPPAPSRGNSLSGRRNPARSNSQSSIPDPSVAARMRREALAHMHPESDSGSHPAASAPAAQGQNPRRPTTPTASEAARMRREALARLHTESDSGSHQGAAAPASPGRDPARPTTPTPSEAARMRSEALARLLDHSPSSASAPRRSSSFSGNPGPATAASPQSHEADQDAVRRETLHQAELRREALRRMSSASSDITHVGGYNDPSHVIPGSPTLADGVSPAGSVANSEELEPGRIRYDRGDH
ncbi:hypothetical protein HK405_003926 [Cladochytrium tenue]|nr:hypothetical protein HK405_003926 [Cladochytrium tenue]